jgi:hypothetical protein
VQMAGFPAVKSLDQHDFNFVDPIGLKPSVDPIGWGIFQQPARKPEAGTRRGARRFLMILALCASIRRKARKPMLMRAEMIRAAPPLDECLNAAETMPESGTFEMTFCSKSGAGTGALLSSILLSSGERLRFWPQRG